MGPALQAPFFMGGSMQNAVIFVDAGYLFSGGSDAAFGRVVARKRLELERPENLIATIFDETRSLWDGEPLRLLRTYWYDGALNGIPSPTQISIGELPKVKLRLGRISAGGQKGVDGLIILDLITVARNRAADVAIVLSGDEDLRETALHAQSFGLTVVLVGFPPSPRQRQSALLMREADHVVKLRADQVAPHLVQVTPEGERAAVAATVDAPATEQPADQAGEEAQAPAEATLSHPDTAEVSESLESVCRSVITDPRFATSQDIVVTTSEGLALSLSPRADRVLIARLSELTGTFPVDQGVVRQARARCMSLMQEQDK